MESDLITLELSFEIRSTPPRCRDYAHHDGARGAHDAPYLTSAAVPQRRGGAKTRQSLREPTGPALGLGERARRLRRGAGAGAAWGCVAL